MQTDNFEGTKGSTVLVEDESGEGEAFIPPKLPVDIDLDNEIMNLLSKAKFNLGQLYRMGADLDNPELYYGPALLLEALSSSRIEGTRTTMEKVLESDLEEERDYTEFESKEEEVLVRSLRNSIKYGLKRIKRQRLDNDLIKRIHERILGHSDLNVGEFRERQVKIGAGSVNLQDAFYVPPPSEKIPELMENLTTYINRPDIDDLPLIVKIAVIHYHFEAIHPFEDGNGRLGRLLIMLNLCDEHIGEESPILNDPFLNMSDFFLRNRQQYYDRLLKVSKDGDYKQWIKFFLRGVIDQSKNAIDTLEDIEKLRRTYRNRVDGVGFPGICPEVVDSLFNQPFVKIPHIQEKYNVSYQTARNAVHALEQEDILKEKEPNSRPKLFVCNEILDIIYSEFEIQV